MSTQRVATLTEHPMCRKINVAGVEEFGRLMGLKIPGSGNTPCGFESRPRHG